MRDNLKQKGFVEEYIKAHNKIQQLANSHIQANQGFFMQIFLWNLKPEIAIVICEKDCETIEDASCEAWNTKQKAKYSSCTKNGNNKSQGNDSQLLHK